MQVDWRADHGFHSPDPLMTQELGIPNACSKCHTDESRSVRIAASRGLAARNQDVVDPVAANEWAEYLNFNSDRHFTQQCGIE
jgi:hypothetical protein